MIIIKKVKIYRYLLLLPTFFLLFSLSRAGNNSRIRIRMNTAVIYVVEYKEHEERDEALRPISLIVSNSRLIGMSRGGDYYGEYDQ